MASEARVQAWRGAPSTRRTVQPAEQVKDLRLLLREGGVGRDGANEAGSPVIVARLEAEHQEVDC